MERTKIQQGIYMLRNLVVGDGEQCRIVDLYYINPYLPLEAKQTIKYLLDTATDYNTSCAIYVRCMLEGVTPDHFKVSVKEFLVEWLQDMDMEFMTKKDVKEYLDGLEEDLLNGFNKYVNQRSVEYLLLTCQHPKYLKRVL